MKKQKTKNKKQNPKAVRKLHFSNIKANKGITLVALIVTIIILLILAGVTIIQLTGNGLFENAKLAKEKHENAQEEENTILADYENKILEYVEGSNNIENSTLVEKPTITLNTVTISSIKIDVNIGNFNEEDIDAYVFYNGDTQEIIKIIEKTEDLIINNLENNTQYNIYMKIRDIYGTFSEVSNVLTFTTKKFGTLNITYALGGSYSTPHTDVTSSVKTYLFDGILTKQGNYGAFLLSGANNTTNMTFNVENGDLYITFCSNSYSDSGGSSGQVVNFYKLNSNNEYELYTSFAQQNNNTAYSKTFFEEGSYKMALSSNYVQFDEWIITED